MAFRFSNSGQSSDSEPDIYTKLGLDRKPLSETYCDPYEEDKYVAEEISDETRRIIEEQAKKLPKNINPKRTYTAPANEAPAKKFNIPRTARDRQQRSIRRRERMRDRAPTLQQTAEELKSKYGKKTAQKAEEKKIRSSVDTETDEAKLICNPHYCDPNVWQEAPDVMNHIFSHAKDVFKFYAAWYPIYYANQIRDLDEMYFRDLQEKIHYNGGAVDKIFFFQKDVFFATNAVRNKKKWPRNHNVIQVICKFNDMSEDVQASADAQWNDHDGMMSKETLLSFASDSLRCSLVFATEMSAEATSVKMNEKEKRYADVIVGLWDMSFYLFMT